MICAACARCAPFARVSHDGSAPRDATRDDERSSLDDATTDSSNADARDAFDLYAPIAEALAAEPDGGHAFYLGVELGRAQVAFELGKRYQQDRDLDWASAVDRKADPPGRHRAPGPTLKPTMAGRRRKVRQAP